MQLKECKRNNLCYECDDKTCRHAGQLIADCILWECDRDDDHYEDCESCEMLKRIHEVAKQEVGKRKKLLYYEVK